MKFMEANICAKCLEEVHSLENMRTTGNYGKCEVCGNTSVFYARGDEIKIAKEIYNKQNS